MKTEIQKLIFELENSIGEERQVLENPGKYHNQDVAQARLIVSTTENIIKKIEGLSTKGAELEVTATFQPTEIDKAMHIAIDDRRKIIDEHGWNGEWRVSAKEVLDIFLELKNPK